jgi:hypothetical protein
MPELESIEQIEVENKVEMLMGNVICLCLLLRNVDRVIHSITFCIADSIYETAKSILNRFNVALINGSK